MKKAVGRPLYDDELDGLTTASERKTNPVERQPLIILLREKNGDKRGKGSLPSMKVCTSSSISTLLSIKATFSRTILEHTPCVTVTFWIFTSNIGGPTGATQQG